MAFPLRCDLSPCRELFARESPDRNYFLRDTSVTSASMCSTCGWGFAPATATGRCICRVMCCLIRSTEEQPKNMHIGNKKPAFIKLGKRTGSCDTEIFLWPVSEVIVQNRQIMAPQVIRMLSFSFPLITAWHVGLFFFFLNEILTVWWWYGADGGEGKKTVWSDSIATTQG